MIRSTAGSTSENITEYNWELRKSKHKPRGFWEDTTNHKQFFDWPQNKLEYKCMDDWYKVAVEDIHKNGGSGLLSKYYNDSPSKALMSIYPHEVVALIVSWCPYDCWILNKYFRNIALQVLPLDKKHRALRYAAREGYLEMLTQLMEVNYNFTL